MLLDKMFWKIISVAGLLGILYYLPVPSLSQDDRGLLEELQKKVINVSAKVVPSFVFVSAGERGAGSGVIISNDGYFLTNHHVAGSLKETDVYLVNGKKYTAKRICRDPFGDIALFKIESKDKFVSCELGDSDKIKIGEYVLAVGDPFVLSFPPSDKGRNPTITLGIISAVHRNQGGGYSDTIQTSAPINPGNSGGPLFTLDGKLIGINGRILCRFFTKANTGIGLSIPINQIKRFLDAMKKGGENGKVYHAKVDGLKLSNLFSNGEGAVILKVKKGSEADKSGLKAGDVITQLDDYKIFSKEKFLAIVSCYPANQSVKLKLISGGKTKEAKIVLGKNMPEEEKPHRPDAGWLGIKYVNAPNSKGVIVTEVVPGSPAEIGGIQEGDVITEFDNKKIIGKKNKSSTKLLTELLEEKDAGDIVDLKIKRSIAEIDLRITLAKYPAEKE